MKSLSALIIVALLLGSMVFSMSQTPDTLVQPPMTQQSPVTKEPPVTNTSSKVLAERDTKGLMFKDKVKLVSFKDPTIEGITCYATATTRTMTLENESSDGRIRCIITGEVKGELTNLENVFNQDKKFLDIYYKVTQVDRVYDKDTNSLIYMMYTKSYGEGKNLDHDISVVQLK